MKFHAPVSGDLRLELPIALGHFLPWFTIRGADFPLHPDDAATLDWLPQIEDMRHWNDARATYRRTHLHLPSIGVYDSRDPRVIEWQIAMALAHGINGFIINWYGKYSVENVITLHWLRGLRQWNTKHPDQPFHYFISFDSQAQWPTEGKKPVSLAEDFAYIKQHLITDAYLRRDERPVFAAFAYENNCRVWRDALDIIFGAGEVDLIWMNETPGGGENAAYPWARPDDDGWHDPDDAGTNRLRQFYERADGVDYLMAGVWPGFNDQLVRWAWNSDVNDPRPRPRVMCRETTGGNTLDRTWQVYLDYLQRWANVDPSARLDCPLIQIVTWNDYNETTTVEPTRDYGTAQLELCKQRLAEARKLWRSRKSTGDSSPSTDETLRARPVH